MKFYKIWRTYIRFTSMTFFRTETETVSLMQKAGPFDSLLQPSVGGVDVSLLVSGLTVDILSTSSSVFMIHCVKLMLIIFEFGFYCLTVLFITKMLICLKRFTRYGHYAGEVEDIIIGRLAVVS